MRSWIWACTLLALAGCERPAHQAEARVPPYKMQLSLKELMERAIDPAADAIWASTGFVVDEKGTTDLSPKTQEGWRSVGNSAATLAELSNALMIPPRAQNAPEWNANARKIYDLAMSAMKAADRQDKESLMRIGGELDDACDGCHKRFVLGEK